MKKNLLKSFFDFLIYSVTDVSPKVKNMYIEKLLHTIQDPFRTATFIQEPTEQRIDTLFCAYKLDFSTVQRVPKYGGHGSQASFRLKKKVVTKPVQKSSTKKGLRLILWILMKKGIWFSDLPIYCSFIQATCVVPRFWFTCSKRLLGTRGRIKLDLV